MPYTNPTNDWPTVADVQAYLTATGHLGSPLTPIMATLPWEAFLGSAIERLEELTDMSPFRAEVMTLEVGTHDLYNRAADPWGDPYRIVTLPAPLVEVTLIELASGGINGATPTTTPLQTLVYGRDWSYVERSNTLRGKPHKTLSFHTGCCCGSGVSGVLRITGTWGYSASIRADVWTLVLEYAAALAAPAVQSANSLGVATGAPSAGSAAAGTGLVEVEVKTEEVSRKFGVISKDAASLGFNTLAKPGTWAAGVDTRMQALAARLRGPVMA